MSVRTHQIVAKIAWSYLTSFVIVILTINTYAHTAAHTRIEQLDIQIRESPHNARLYLQRAELYRTQRNWVHAKNDYELSQKLDSSNKDVDFLLGRMWLESGAPENALPALNQYLQAFPTHLEALLNRARAYTAIDQPFLGAQDLNQFLSLHPHSTPEIYLERAQMLQRAGETHIPDALKGLQEGIKKIGPLVSLISLAVKLSTEMGRFELALTFIDLLKPSIQNSPLWLNHRAELLLSSGRYQAALTYVDQALNLIEQLPKSRNNSPSLQAIKTELIKKQNVLIRMQKPQ